MSSHIKPDGRAEMRNYAQQILDAIEALGSESIAPQSKVTLLRDMLVESVAEEKKNIRLTNNSIAATAKTKAIHGTAKGQSVDDPGSLKFALNHLYNHLKNEIGKDKMLLREYGFQMQHSKIIGIDEEGVGRTEEDATGSGKINNQQQDPDTGTGAQPKED